MTLFEHRMARDLDRLAPLAERMRPRILDEFVGQEHILGPDTVLRRSLDAGHVPSIVLWGPPGTGKTTLAQIIANSANAHFERVSAVTSGVADLRRVVSDAADRLGMHGERTILFVDEIHRFNKAQQDVILPHVERGTIILIGATTENPSFEVISPLLSRARVYTLRQLTAEQISAILDSAMADSRRGLASLKPTLDDDAREALIALSNGDARSALNTLELAANGTQAGDGRHQACIPGDCRGRHTATCHALRQVRRPALRHHLGVHQVGPRSSDPDAAVYWLARMLNSGEDLMFIARRLVILAAEDVGLADPNALTVAVSAQQAVHLIGMPEGRIPLSEATVYLASAPKSNRAYMAINQAMRDAERSMNEPVPLHLRNAVTSLMRDQDYGKGYKYAHDYEGGFTPTQNLPEISGAGDTTSPPSGATRPRSPTG